LILSAAFISFKTSGFATAEVSSQSDYPHSWTKAICNETSCQDYVINCSGERLIGQTPITGAVITLPKDWEDPRNETMRERVCNFD
jgi:hypothetical protein